MKMQSVAMLLVLMLAFQPGLTTRAGAKEGPQEKEAARIARLKQKVLDIPLGTSVKVRLTNGDRLQGRMGAITNEGFTLAEEDNPQAQREVPFSELRSIKVRKQGLSQAKPLVRAAILSGILGGAILISALLLRT